MKERWLLEILVENPNLSLSHSRNGWFFTGSTLRDIKIPQELSEEGYKVSAMGIYKDSDEQQKTEYLAMFCLD